MIYRHTDQDIDSYFRNESLNQSSIKTLINEGLEKYIECRDELKMQEELYYSEKEHFIIGSAVDCWLTQGKEAFDSKYAYSKLVNKPSEKPMSIINMVFDKVSDMVSNAVGLSIDPDLSAYKRQIYDACNEHQYYMNRKIPSDKPVKLEKFDTLTGEVVKLKKGEVPPMGDDPRSWEEDKRWRDIVDAAGIGQQYWEELLDSVGKQLLSQRQAELISTIVSSFVSHRHTANLFKDADNMDIIYQMPLYFSVQSNITNKEIACKALPDMIVVRHNEQKIYHIDIKTMGDYILNFKDQFRIRRYDLQGSFYNTAIWHNKKAIGDLIGKNIENYAMADPAFIVESTKKPGTPMVYVMTAESNLQASQGDSRYLKGWNQGIGIYSLWKECNFSIEERFKETNGILWIDNFFDYNEIV